MFIEHTENEERQALRGAVRDLLRTHSSESTVRRMLEAGDRFDPDLFRRMTAMGLTALTVPAAVGGIGGNVIDEVIVFEELGRALVPSPLLATVGLTSPLLTMLEGEQAVLLLQEIAQGKLLATVALHTVRGGWRTPDDGLEATSAPDGWVITGQRRFVLDGLDAQVVLVPTTTAKGLSVFAVDLSDERISRTSLTTLDLTRGQADIEFNGAPARLVGEEGAAAGAIQHCIERGILALVSEQTGAAEHLVAMALDYAKQRYQFGRLVGEFQAIKHKFADMAFDVERMKSAQVQLAEAMDRKSEDVAISAHLAKAFCSEAFFRIAAETIQIHGGIGFTWEHSAHLYFRRAKSTEVLFGRPSQHREAMLQLLEAA